MLLWFLLCFFALILIGVPVAFSLGITMFILLATMTSLPPLLVPQQMVIGADNFSLIAVPFFMLAAEIMSSGGITRRLVDFLNGLIGWITGGLALVNIAASMLMAGLSGSSVADASMMGSMLIPAMKQKGYTPEYSAAVTATSSTVGIIIPPSIPMIVLGSIAGISVIKLFAGGMIPGILVGGSLLLVAYITSRIAKYPREERVSLRILWQRMLETFWALLLPLIVLGGILGGVMTVTEASTVAVVYALIVSVFIYREITWKSFYSAVIRAALTSSAVMLIVAAASGMAWLLTSNQVPQSLAANLQAMTSSAVIFLLLVNIFLLLVGSVMDLTAALLVLGPILLPVAMRYGIDPIHFGVIMVTNLAIGLVTPPVGSCLYLTVPFAGVPVTRIIRATTPFLLAEIAVLFLITYFPWLVTFVPSLF